METVTGFIVAIEAAVFLAVIAILIYLIIKRIDDKGKETFEQRDN